MRSHDNGLFSELWIGFWGKPDYKCPKCNHENIEYYDPFFFNPMRTLLGKRRVKCITCRFIWRPKKTSASILERFFPMR